MKNYKTIHDLLSDWGKDNQKSPVNNAVLKSTILNKLPVTRLETTRIRTPLPWLSFAFASLAIIVTISSSIDYNKYKAITSVSYPAREEALSDSDMAYPTVGETAAGNPVLQSSKSIAPEYYPRDGYYGEPPISDGREFLKTSYNSTVRTRHVTDTKMRIETIVRGFDGRIDGSSSAEKHGYVSFAIPANKFEAFRQDMKNLVGEKLYIEQISTQNLLPQKQSIEEQQVQTEKYISGLKSERTKLVNSHNQAVSSLQSRINIINAEITQLEIENQTALPQRKVEISYRITALQTERNTVQGQLGSENKNYQNRLADIDSQLKNWSGNLDSIKKQDKNLVESVATVTGTISLSWIGLWEMSDIYTPGPLLAWILLAGALIAYFYHRRYLEITI